MRLLFLVKMAAVVGIAVIRTRQGSACRCGSNIHGKNSREVATLEAPGSAVIIEGTPERFELEWSLLNAKEGELIPAGNPGANRNSWPRMLVTFRVQRAYKGDLGPEVQLRSSLGGGDCGAQVDPGLACLVYADGPTLGGLGVSMCSTGNGSEAVG
jgi:hypothetical protein